VALCSFTTIVGYSSLLVAKNVGLFLFGVLAVLGEVTCLVTAIIVLPAVLLLVRPASTPPLPAFEWDKPTNAPAAEVLPPAPRPEIGP
jgi:predicted RND superfamily exporter protein